MMSRIASSRTLRWVLLGLLLAASGCVKKSQHAIVIAKKYIPAHVEGTEYKEREMDHEQWLVNVQMEDFAKNDAPVDKAQFESLQIGDRVRAKYSQGKYTGTVWAIALEKE